MNKNRFYPFILVLAIALLLAACGGKNAVTDTVARTTSANTEEAPVVEATRIVTETQVLETAPDEAAQAEREVVTETLIVEVAEAVPGQAIRILGSNDEIIQRYLLKDANAAGTQTIEIPQDAFVTISGEGCVLAICAPNPGFTALIHGPGVITTTVPYGNRHVNMSASMYQAGTADPQYMLALLQFAEGKAVVLEIDEDGNVQRYSTNVGDTEEIEDLFLQPTSPAGDLITFDVALTALEDVEPDSAAMTPEDAENAQAADVCGKFDGEDVVLEGQNIWISTDGPITYNEEGKDEVIILGPHATFGVNVTATISNYPKDATTFCINATIDNYDVDGKPQSYNMGDLAK